MKSNLALMEKLAGLLDSPYRAYPTIHVAGTNGKGSVGWKIAKALELSGYRVGLYSSPHLETTQERIRINGEVISQELFLQHAAAIIELAAGERERVTFFEVMTLMAFCYFKERTVDVAVIETGVGGRLDTTNVIKPILSIVTSIGWDHADALGGTLEAIAEQKAGVIKPGTPIVIGPHARHSVLLARAKAVEAPLFVNKGVFAFYDDENCATARLALEQLGKRFSLSEEAIEKGLATRPPCRFERIGNIIYDVAHNGDGIRCLLAAIERHFPGRPFRVVCGFAKDKAIQECLELLAVRAVRLHLIKVPTPKEGCSVEELERVLQSVGFENYEGHPRVADAMAAAMESGVLVVVCGSFYLMKEAKAAQQQLQDL